MCQKLEVMAARLSLRLCDCATVRLCDYATTHAHAAPLKLPIDSERVADFVTAHWILSLQTTLDV